MIVQERATAYVVSVVPREYQEWSTWSVTVEERGPDRWAVLNGPWVYSRSQIRSKKPVGKYERSPSSRSDYFRATYRFPLDEALALARILAPKLVMNGLTGQGYVDWYDAKHGKPTEADL